MLMVWKIPRDARRRLYCINVSLLSDLGKKFLMKESNYVVLLTKNEIE